MSKIIPSTQLKVVSVHKLGDVVCPRKFFFRRVLNLQSIKLSLPFFYGGVLGAGFEAHLSGKKIEPAMKKEDRLRRRGHKIDYKLKEELDFQYKLIRVLLEGAKRHPDVKRMKMTQSQVVVRRRLKCGVLFIGAMDGIGTYDSDSCMFEIKTASKVNAEYLQSLRYGKQVNGYPWAYRKPLGKCAACIFKKPQKRIKRGQTPDEYLEEIRQDTIDRPEMYYVFEKFSLGTAAIREAGKDIEANTVDLLEKYKRLSKTELLDPNNWGKQEDKCHEYKGCEFIQLCSHPNNWKLYLRFFTQRTMLYEEEEGELAK